MKKYSEKFLNNSNILKHAVIGFEFEHYIKDLSYYQTLEKLNQLLEGDGVHVFGFRSYHSQFTPTATQFKIESDLSGGANMIELITGPLPYFQAKYFLIKILKFIQDFGYTTEKASIHFNISFSQESGFDLNDINILKLILNIDEEEIYRVYPSRANNTYAKSVKKLIPYKDYNFNSVPIDVIKNTLRLPSEKYYGINILHINDPKETQRLEFRYIGGTDYEKNIGQLLYFMDKFIINSYNSIGATFNDKDIEELEVYLDKNINNFKSLSTYDSFIVEFPTISLQVNQLYDYDVINAYYDKLFVQLFNIIESTESLKDCIINFVTDTNMFEVIDGTIKATQNIKHMVFINCIITDGIFEECQIINSELTNCQVIKTKIYGCKVTDTKVLNSEADVSELYNCYVQNSYINCNMYGGVFRSGKLGPFAILSSDTKIITDEEDNFFNTKYDAESEKGKYLNNSVNLFKK